MTPLSEVERRVTFITAGQSPRIDIVTDARAHVDGRCRVIEIGALDGMTHSEVAELAPHRDECSIVTALADGRRVVVSGAWLSRKVALICNARERGPSDLVVVGATGLVDTGPRSPYVIQAQTALEHTMETLYTAGQTAGRIFPLARQTTMRPSSSEVPFVGAHAEPGDAAALVAACERLAPCDYIVLNSISYSEADRTLVAETSGKLVLLIRRIVSGLLDKALRQCGRSAAAAFAPEGPLAELVAALTPREYQVFELVVAGRANKEIARTLAISPRTVEIHRGHMMEKMGVSSAAGLIWMVANADGRRPS